MEINNKEKVKKVAQFLKCFCKISNEEKKDFIMNCPHTMITCFSEICYNLLKNKHLKKQKNIRAKTENIKKQMKWMMNSTNPNRKKRALLLQSDFGDILFDVISENLLPFLTKLLKKTSHEYYE